MRYIILIFMCLALGACSSLQGTASNPLIQGAVNIATASACRDFAVKSPSDARTTAAVLQSIVNAASGCVTGIDAGLHPTPAPGP